MSEENDCPACKPHACHCFPQPPPPSPVISEEAREAATKAARQMGMYDPQFHPIETRNVIELIAGFNQLAITAATEKLTKENQTLSDSLSKAHALLKDFATNYDCDEWAHGTHHSQCRACKAKNLLEPETL